MGQMSKVTRLLKRGLRHYAVGDIEAAIVCWERVCELDPENSAARDYLHSAYEALAESEDDTPVPIMLSGDEDPFASQDAAPRSFAESPRAQPSSSEWAQDPEVSRALQALKEGDLDTAWNLLQGVTRAQPGRLDVQGHLGQVRTQRARCFEAEIGGLDRRLVLVWGGEALKEFDLTPEAGFLLSQIDGSLRIEELLSLSTTGRTETLELLVQLLQQGIVK